MTRATLPVRSNRLSRVKDLLGAILDDVLSEIVLRKLMVCLFLGEKGVCELFVVKSLQLADRALNVQGEALRMV